MLFFTERSERFTRLIERPFRLSEVVVRHRHVRLGLASGILQLADRESTLLQCVLPLRALCRQGCTVILAARDLIQARRCLLARRGCVRMSSACALCRGRQARFDLRGLDLPADALLARCFLLSLQIGESCPFCAQMLRRANAFELAFLQLRVHAVESALDFRQPVREPVHLRRDFFGLAARVNQSAIRFALLRARLQLGTTCLLGGVRGGGERLLRGCELDRTRSSSRSCSSACTPSSRLSTSASRCVSRSICAAISSDWRRA